MGKLRIQVDQMAENDQKLKTKGGYGILEEIVTLLEDNPN